MTKIVDLSSDEEPAHGEQSTSASENGKSALAVSAENDSPSKSPETPSSITEPKLELSCDGYTCNICNKHFIGVIEFIQHRRTHDESSVDSALPKKSSEKRAQSISSGSSKSKKNTTLSTSANVKCWVCLKRFPTDRLRKAHMKTHTRRPPLNRVSRHKYTSKSKEKRDRTPTRATLEVKGGGCSSSNQDGETTQNQSSEGGSNIFSIMLRNDTRVLDHEETSYPSSAHSDTAPTISNSNCLTITATEAMDEDRNSENDGIHSDRDPTISNSKCLTITTTEAMDEDRNSENDSILLDRVPTIFNHNDAPEFSEQNGTGSENFPGTFEQNDAPSQDVPGTSEQSDDAPSRDKSIASGSKLDRRSSIESEFNKTELNIKASCTSSSFEQRKSDKDIIAIKLQVVDVVDMSQFVYKKSSEKYMCKFCLIRFSSRKRRSNHEMIVHRKLKKVM